MDLVSQELVEELSTAGEILLFLLMCELDLGYIFWHQPVFLIFIENPGGGVVFCFFFSFHCSLQLLLVLSYTFILYNGLQMENFLRIYI